MTKMPQVLALLLVWALNAPIHAELIIDFDQAGDDVVATATGSINLAELLGASTPPLQRANVFPSAPLGSTVTLGPASSGRVDAYGIISGPRLFGSGGRIDATAGVGDFVGVLAGDDLVFVPEGYVSGDPISSSSTWSGHTISSLGLFPGTYAWTWGSGATADSITLNVEGIPSVVIFNNYGPGDEYDNIRSWTVRDFPPLPDIDQADSFAVAGGDFFLDRIEIQLGHLTGTNRGFVSIYSDDGGAPGTMLETVAVENLEDLGGMIDPPVVADFGGTTLLEDGMSYWVVALPDQGAWLGWNLNSIGDFGPHAFRQNLGPWTVTNDTRGAFRVIGMPVPTPVTHPTAVLLSLAAMPRRRCRRNAFRDMRHSTV